MIGYHDQRDGPMKSISTFFFDWARVRFDRVSQMKFRHWGHAVNTQVLLWAYEALLDEFRFLLSPPFSNQQASNGPELLFTIIAG